MRLAARHIGAQRHRTADQRVDRRNQWRGCRLQASRQVVVVRRRGQLLEDAAHAARVRGVRPARIALLRQHQLVRDVDLVVDHQQLGADCAQGLLGRTLEHIGCRLLVAVGANACHAQLARNLDELLHGVAPTDEQASPTLGQTAVEVLKSLDDEAELRVADATALHRRIEDVQKRERRTRVERSGDRVRVVEPQVAAEPDEDGSRHQGDLRSAPTGR